MSSGPEVGIFVRRPCTLVGFGPTSYVSTIEGSQMQKIGLYFLCDVDIFAQNITQLSHFIFGQSGKISPTAIVSH